MQTEYAVPPPPPHLSKSVPRAAHDSSISVTHKVEKWPRIQKCKTIKENRSINTTEIDVRSCFRLCAVFASLRRGMYAEGAL